MTTQPPTPATPTAWARFIGRSVQLFHAYAGWLVGISWRRFFVLSLGLIITVAIVHDVPPFSWTYTEVLPARDQARRPAKPPRTPTPPAKRTEPPAVEPPATPQSQEGVEINIDERGVTVTPRAGASAPASSASDAKGSGFELKVPGVSIRLPPGADAQAVREAVEEARREIRSAIDEAKEDAKDAAREAAEARGPRFVSHKFGEPLMPLTMWFIFISAIIKFTYKGTVAAEAKAAQATEVAESESLKRQVIEARMAAMQAQVEPHFLFNTLASIDHLIETDPARASIMQKNLIALLRASMPTMREANARATRDLGRELAMIRPYLEILKVRMEERLQTDIRVSDGLLSAEFPPMMLQSLVENAIKHGLEPKAEGGQLTVSAEIVHGKLAVTVADTGLGFGKAATNGTGIGLSNIRERLTLLYGAKASLSVGETPGGGTSVTITVPYAVNADAQAETSGP